MRVSAGVVLIDLMLPDMSGIDVMTKIRAAAPYTEAIILTGHASLDSAVEAINEGAFSYLLKPYDIEKLLRHIRRALDRRKTRAGDAPPGIVSRVESLSSARGQCGRRIDLYQSGGCVYFSRSAFGSTCARRVGGSAGGGGERRAQGSGA